MMGWGVYLEHDGVAVDVERHAEGGTYVVGGSTEAWLSVTYNYGRFYKEHFDSEQNLDWLNGKTGEDSIPKLEAAIAILGTERSADYWQATAGNAGHALSILLKWARQHPTAVFSTRG